MDDGWLGPELAWDVCVKHGWQFILCLGVKFEKQREGSHSPLPGATLMTSKGSPDLVPHRLHPCPVAPRQWPDPQHTGPGDFKNPACLTMT